jgi:hypothetical protein
MKLPENRKQQQQQTNNNLNTTLLSHWHHHFTETWAQLHTLLSLVFHFCEHRWCHRALGVTFFNSCSNRLCFVCRLHAITAYGSWESTHTPRGAWRLIRNRLSTHRQRHSGSSDTAREHRRRLFWCRVVLRTAVMTYRQEWERPRKSWVIYF